MFRARQRSESSSRSTARRGSVGSARVWDERTRALHSVPPPAAPPESSAPPEPAPLQLPSDELAALVRGIVQATLDTRLAAHEPKRRAELARELEARLLALFSAPPASGAPSPGAALPDAETGQDEGLAEEPATRASAPPPAPLTRSPADHALGLALEDRLVRLGGPLAARSDLRERLIALALERLAGVPRAGTASGDELRGLDVLQRRAAKLERSLHETRAALAYVAGLERVDMGIASIFRSVQGLSFEDPQRERKQHALESLFRANLALQKPGPDGPGQAPRADQRSE